jgi:sulfopyruvate decarboxylase TPP-binding subunit
MGMSLERLILSELKQCGFQWIVWLPDSETRTMYDLMRDDPELRLVQVCREDEAVGICYGLLKGGQRAAVMIQNTGLMNAIDAIRGIPIRMRQAMLLLIGYRGYRTMVGKTDPVDNAAVFTEPLLQALQIPYYLIRTSADVGKLRQAYEQAQRMCAPAAVLVTRE